MESQEESTKTAKRHRVFLSYASADKEIAHRIVNELRERSIRVWFDVYELQPGDSIARAIEKDISASDYLIVLLSPNSVNSVWIQKELGAALSQDLTSRDITLLPVVIAACEIPKFLSSYQYLDLHTNFEHSVARLVEQIITIPEIDFSELHWGSFEELIVDLLDKRGFNKIVREGQLGKPDRGFDIKAEYSRIDPFGVKVTETWLVEMKLYHKARADLKSVEKLAGYLSELPIQSKGLLVTNSQLTSATRHWLMSVESNRRLEIRVIDGTELKRLLLQHADLVEKYFVKKYTAAK